MSDEQKTDPHPAAVEFFGTAKGARAWSATMGVLREFATADGCPLGISVTDWFVRRSAGYHEYFAQRKAREVRQAPPPSPPPPGVSR